ncbi:11097_t:CDS:2 [Entrophospora sp. SA101]|nr:11097_t:CDS:2 [Entrophospora sp. SA101]
MKREKKLQELAKTPFCVVEVNQGMDSINECLAHNQMIETACQSQYFLITSEFLSDCNCKYHASYVVEISNKPNNDSIKLFTVEVKDIVTTEGSYYLVHMTKKDSYPLPRIDDTLETLQGSQWFLSLNSASGYWQVEMKPEDIQKAAFITHHGLFEFTVMPFGLTNVPGTIQRLMDEVLRDLLWKSVVVYLDDLNIFLKTWKEHLEHLENVFERIQKAVLKLSPQKCQFGNTVLKFLGHIVGNDGIKIDPTKIEKVQNFPKPINVTQVEIILHNLHANSLARHFGIEATYHRIAERFYFACFAGA